MRQVAIHAPGDVRFDAAPDPVAAAGDVVVRVEACGICGTDLTFVAYGGGGAGSAMPMPLGHEAVGIVEQVGAGVTGISPGMRVFVNPMTGGQDPSAAASVIGNGGPEGAFADRLLVRNAVVGETLFPIPDDLPSERAALVEPLAVALHSVNRADPQPGSTVVVYGAGPIGLGAVIWLKRRGVGRIVVVDLNPGRLDRATALGATDVVDAGREDLFAALARICGTTNVFGIPAVDADIFIDMAGAPGLVAQTIGFAKFGARMIVTAAYKAPVEIDLRRMLLSEFSIALSIGYPTELPDVVAALPELGDAAQHLISHRFVFDRFFDALATAQGGDCAKVMVLFPETPKEAVHG